MNCKKCGNILSKDDRFCTECGLKIILNQAIDQQGPAFRKKIEFLFSKISLAFLNKKFLVGFLIFTITAFIFFWFAILPKKQKSDCHYEAIRRAGIGGSMGVYDSFYKKCLRRKGL